MSKNIQILFAIFALSCITASFATSCPESVLENAPDVVKFAAEVQEGAISGLGSFVSSLGDICQDCNLNCGFLSQLSADHISGAVIGCVSGVASTIEGFVQAAGTDGIDVIGDVQLGYGVYKLFTDCQSLGADIANEMEESSEEEDEAGEGSGESFETNEESNEESIEEESNEESVEESNEEAVEESNEESVEESNEESFEESSEESGVEESDEESSEESDEEFGEESDEESSEESSDEETSEESSPEDEESSSGDEESSSNDEEESSDNEESSSESGDGEMFVTKDIVRSFLDTITKKKNWII